jgi:hypothetical protein
MANVQDNIWFAGPVTIARLFKWCLYDDTGSIQYGPENVRFTGRKGNTLCSKVVGISLVRQPIPWLSILFTAVLLVAMTSSGLMTFFTWENPATIPLVIGFILLYAWIAGPVQWVEVDYVDESGAAQKAYFLDGGGGGFARLFGATRRLHGELRAVVLQPAS